MPYTLIKGEYHIHYPDMPRNGPEPDGDTVKFLPDNPAIVERLHRPGSTSPRFNRRNMINLRFEGIDALETHFDEMHQNLQWAEAARDAVLAELGFGNVTYYSDLTYKVETVQHHPQRGYILARTLDGHGRIVSFIFSGDASQTDGSEIWVDVPTIDGSINAKLISSGLVYPAFYTTLPVDLKDHFAALTIQARINNYGLWPEDAVSVDKFARVDDLDALQDLVIWPKLFRRLSRYFAAGNQTLTQFDTWLRADRKDRDDRVVLPDRELGNMHDVIEISDNRIRMKYNTEEIIILPDDASVPITPVPLPRTIADIFIVAAMVNPIGPETGNETVTLLNTTPDIIDLTGWSIMDRVGGKHPLNGSLDAGHILQEPLSSKVRLGNKGDTITVLNSSGDQVDQVSYSEDDARREGWTVVFH